MPSRRSGGGKSGETTRRKHSLGNLRRAHPASGASWNVQVVRGKMSSKCLWHACRALILGLSLMLLGASMATLGYYADHLSISTELRGNSTIRVKNDLKGFHLNNFAYVGPIVMGFGGFIVVASCVMTFEARDSAAKVVPARLRAGTSAKTTIRSQASSASQRRTMGMLHSYARWDHQFGVFRSSPAHVPLPQAPLDREALTAELVKFSKSLSKIATLYIICVVLLCILTYLLLISASSRFSPKLRCLTYAGSVPELSTSIQTTHAIAYSSNISHLLSPKFKPMLNDKCFLNNYQQHRHYQHQQQLLASSFSKTYRHQHHHHHHRHRSSGGRHVKPRVPRIEAHPRLTTRDNSICTLLQPPTHRNIYWKASSFDESSRAAKPYKQRATDVYPNRRSDTAKRHVLARQKTIEHDEDQISPLGKRRDSTMSDSQFNSRQWCRSAMGLRTSSIDSRRIQVDLHSPELVPKSILRSPKRYSSGPTSTPSVEREFRSQLSVCSAPPAAMHELSGQSSIEPCVPEESIDFTEDQTTTDPTTTTDILASPPESVAIAIPLENMTQNEMDLGKDTQNSPVRSLSPKKPRPDSLPIKGAATPTEHEPPIQLKSLQRSGFSRSFCLPKRATAKASGDVIFFIKSDDYTTGHSNDDNDSFRVINERRRTLLRAESETALGEQHKGILTGMQNIPEHTVESQTMDTGHEII